jgi:uncharacterized membrane protein
MIKSGVYPEISSRFITSGRRSKIVKWNKEITAKIQDQRIRFIGADFEESKACKET